MYKLKKWIKEHISIEAMIKTRVDAHDFSTDINFNMPRKLGPPGENPFNIIDSFNDSHN